MVLRVAASVLIGYILGSVPTSIIFGKLLRGIDIREHGSGNAGATNTVRVLGAKWGIIVGLIDLAKGALAVAISQWFGLVLPLQIITGVAAVSGHVFPLFAGFRGGKGVATGAGIVLGLFPAAFLLCLGTFFVVLIISGYVSLSSISAAALLPVGVLIFRLAGSGGLEGDAVMALIFSGMLALFVIFLHRKNIRRLRNGEESRFEKIMIFRKKKPATHSDSSEKPTEG